MAAAVRVLDEHIKGAIQRVGIGDQIRRSTMIATAVPLRELDDVVAAFAALSSPPADDVREALAEDEGYEAEKTCALCLRDDVYEEAKPLSDNGVWLHLPGGEVICDRCGMASADAAKAARSGGEVRLRGTVTEPNDAEKNAAWEVFWRNPEMEEDDLRAAFDAGYDAAMEARS